MIEAQHQHRRRRIVDLPAGRTTPRAPAPKSPDEKLTIWSVTRRVVRPDSHAESTTSRTPVKVHPHRIHSDSASPAANQIALSDGRWKFEYA